MIKKSLLLILSVLFSVFANAAILEYGGLRYNILKSDGIAEVVGYGSAPTGALVIPESVYFEGVLCSVKTIASGAFYGCAEITSVEIPNSVETIGHSAFEECSGIETVSIGENVTFIGDCAFCYCSSLTALYIPAKVDSIGVCAFIRCYNIESMTVSDSNKKFDSRGGCNAIIETATNTLIAGCQNTVIPETVTGIGFRAFYEQSKLENLIIPNSVTTIGDESIRDCFGLKTLTIGSGVTEIGYTAILYRSTSLTDIYCYAAEPPACEDTYSSVQVTLHVPEEALEAYKSTAPWSSFGNIVAIAKYAEDVEIGNLTYNINTDSMTAEVSGYVTEPTGELVIPESVMYEGAVCKVTAICESAFDGCSDITSVAVPSTVARMDDNAFLGCTSLTAVHISDLEAWCNIQFGNEASSDDYSNPIYYANHLFLNEEEIVDLIIPESIDTVKARAFVRCNGLQSVTFPEGVKSIGIASFRQCNGLTSLQIPNTVKEICAYAFYGCDNLSSVRLSDGIERVGTLAIYGSHVSLEMHINDLASWCGRSRNGNLSGNSSVRLFLNGEEIKDLVIPEGVTTIGSYAFNKCSGLTSVTIPGSVKTIELDAFAHCSGLASVTFSEGLEQLGQGVFYSCPSLKEVVLPNTLKSIGSGAFRECDSLTSVTLGASTGSIASYAFGGTSLTDLYSYAQTLPETQSEIFVNGASGDYSTLELSGATLHVPEEALETYKSTAPWNEFGNIVAITKYAEDVEIGNLTYNINTDSMTAKVSGYVTEPTGELVIPESVMYEGAVCKVTTINDSAFYSCSGITSVTIPSTVNRLLNSAFYGCEGLTAVHINDLEAWCSTDISNQYAHPLNYAKHLFLNGEEIVDLVIPDGVSIIKGGVFLNCYGLKNVTIPESVKIIENNAFEGCVGLTSIKLPNSITTIENSTFVGCTSLTSVVIPGSVKTIGSSAFRSCSGLTSLTIPNSVTSIGSSAFSWCASLTSLTIPNSVTVIGSSAFRSCSGLKTIEIPNSVTAIGSDAFFGCTSLTSVVIPGSVKTIELDAFANCSGLESVTFSEGLKQLEQGVFYNCSSLKEVVLPNTLESIGSGAFKECDGLTSVVIPESVDSMGTEVFAGCSGLETISVDSNNPKYDSRNDCNAIIETSTNTLISGCMSTIISNSVTAIGSYAFDDCDGLTSVVIPGSVKTIELDAFANCSGLETVTFSEGLEQLGQGVFYSCPSLKEVVLPNTLKSIGSGAFRECDSLTTVTLGASTDSIASYAFGGTSLTDLYCYAQTLPETHSEIFVNGASGDYSTLELSGATLHVPEEALETYKSTAPWNEFGNIVAITKYAEDVEIGNLTYNINTDSLTAEVSGYVTRPTGELVIPESVVFEGAVCKVTAIGSSAFDYCSGLTSVVIPGGVKTIGSDAFWCCSGLTSLTIPNSVTSIGSYAFCSCSGLKTIEIPNSVTAIGTCAFYGCSGLTSVVIPESVDSMGTKVFADCSGLETISVDSNNSKYDSRNDCNAIIETSTNTLIVGSKSTVIPDGVATIGLFAFDDCDGLTSVVIPGSVKTIELDAFANCSGLETVTFSEGLEQLGQGVFYNCSSLKEVVLPNTLESMGEGVFAYCDGLTSVVIPESVDSMGTKVFAGCSGLETISVDSNNPKYDSRNDCNAIIETSTNTLIVGSKSTVIPDGVTTIGSYAFDDCDGLTSVVIPGSVKTIESNAFKSCSGLEEVTFSEGLEQLGQGAFYGCSSLKEVVLPNTLESIGSYAFRSCSGLTSVVIPDSVKTIELDAFAYCSGLESVTFSEGLKQLEQGAFYGCSSLKEVVLPNTLESMGEGVFRDCTSLTTVTLGESIDSIARWALGGTSLTDLYCYAQALPETHSEIFLHNTGYDSDLSGATLHVPEEALEAYKSTAPWSEFGNIVAMRSPVKVTIGSTGATTFCSEYDLDFSDVEGIKAYVATGYNSATGAITMMRVTEVKAGTGLYIRGEAGVYDVPKAEDVTFNSLNMLVGVIAAVSVAPTNGEYTNYVYTKPSGKPAAFYKLTSARNVPAGKSYLQIPTLWLPVASEARIMLDFDDWDATGIDDVEDTSVPGEQIIYDLQGRRVTNPTKGIYIVNGKKVLYR